MQPVVQPVVQPVWQSVVSCKRGLSHSSYTVNSSIKTEYCAYMSLKPFTKID